MEIGLVLDLGELRFERVLGRVLHCRIERGVNEETAVIDLVLRQDQIQIALDRVHRVILLDLKAVVSDAALTFAPAWLLRRPPAKFFSTPPFDRERRCVESPRLPDFSAAKIDSDCGSIRRASPLRKDSASSVLAEVSLRRGLDSVTTGAEINPVHVKLENLLLRELVLDPQRHHRFEQFPAESAAAERKTVAGELLGNAARAFLG